MAGIVSNIIQNSVGGFVTGAVTTVGGYAGDAVGGIGNLIEGAGAAVGNRESPLTLAQPCCATHAYLVLLFEKAYLPDSTMSGKA
jgi:hypothetical protein